MQDDSPAKTYVAVVEDDASLSRSTARLLAAAGFHPVTYSSAEAFLADVDRPSFGCLVLDQQLGGMSGLELESRLAEGGSTTPVVFLTANDEPTELERALRDHGVRVMRKSDTGDRVLAAITQAIDEYRLRVVRPADSSTP